ncbi:hypothetical protein A7985_15145 [Pseudoalteromonas luteoviolacea]|uniref:Peptidyl-prolyl cis-trans isomerase n=1 Tax=Pseudoalteromonas luteoviolacea TaxID=43657 RepID=A0A1C0TNW6_9GAMM|nr:peptidylprolyl isomerase [Pseudoalteromonas luteoviolacea]OCQ20400.1 hypothetical protein A7985_15145 [Pseudoalteromonas luteoviolacea]
MRGIIYFLAGFFSLPSFAALTHITNAELGLMHSLYHAQDRDISKQTLHKRLLENQFLIAQADKRALPLVTRHSDVGFSNNYHVRRYLRAMLTHLYPKLAQQQSISTSLDWTSEKLIAVLGKYPDSGRYSDEQLHTWYGIELMKSPKLTLGDIINDQSMQGRFALHHGDTIQLQTAINEYIRFHNLTTHASTALAKNGLTLERLKLLALGELLRPPMQTYLGIKDEMHGERSDYVEAIRSSLSTKEVNQFYKKNKKDFKYLDNLFALAVIFEDQQHAYAIFKEVKRTSISSTMQRHDLINHFAESDKIQAPVKITRQHAQAWLAQFAFSSQLGQVSRPIRMPSGLWAIVYTEQPTFKFHDPSSETVRYRASLSLTREKAMNKYEKLFSDWKKHHGIKL